MAAKAAKFPHNDPVDPSSSLQNRETSSQQYLQNQSLGPSTVYNTDEHTFLGQLSPISPLVVHELEQPSLSQEYEKALGSSSAQYGGEALSRSSSVASISRGNTLKKKKSLSRKSSLKRSSSRKSMGAGSIGGLQQDQVVDTTSVFYTPVPTSASPTDVLANRFQGWRRLLKDLISYFREHQSAYEQRARGLSKVSTILNNMSVPPGFLTHGGLGDAFDILKTHHKQAALETSKARELENDVISQLSGLRSDLGQKIKEIKGLAGDFKSSVEKEKENTKKLLGTYQDSLTAADSDAKPMIGKEDPYIIKLAVERQVEKQIDEENYLHRAYLNLESSGRELEAIVVGEIQKAISAFGVILSKEAEGSDETLERLRSGPLSMPKDLEWSEFIHNDPNFVTPDVPLRKVENIEYPGRNHPAATEVRAGMLERKSKYLKSYTPGWFVLSPTHLHEFKSSDAVYTQAPVVSLHLLDQKLGAHSQPTSSSHKFVLKGRQTGGMHRGHSWVFRAESYDTMLAWYDDIKSLTEKTGEARNEFIRGHNRVVSSNSTRSVSSLEEDEADQIPFSKENLVNDQQPTSEVNEQRPQPGGRFPSNVDISNKSHNPPSDESEGDHDHKFAGTEYSPQDQFLSTGAPTLNDHHIPIAEIDHYHQTNQTTYTQTTAQQNDNLGYSYISIKNEVKEGQPSKPVPTGGGLVTHPYFVEGTSQNHLPQSFDNYIHTEEPSATEAVIQPETPLATRPEIQPETLPLHHGEASQEIAIAQSVNDDDLESNAKPIHTANQVSESIQMAPIPRVSRMETDNSLSNLHLPGTFPSFH